MLNIYTSSTQLTSDTLSAIEIITLNGGLLELTVQSLSVMVRLEELYLLSQSKTVAFRFRLTHRPELTPRDAWRIRLSRWLDRLIHGGAPTVEVVYNSNEATSDTQDTTVVDDSKPAKPQRRVADKTRK